MSLRASPTDVLGQIAATKIASQELDRVLSNAIGQVDQATISRIRKPRVELNPLIQELGKLEKEFWKDTDVLLKKALRSSHNVPRELRANVSGLGDQLSNSPNSSVIDLMVAVEEV